MGQQTRYTTKLWPKWVQNVQAMIDSKCLVQATCRKCSSCFRVDLEAIKALKGPDYCLIDRTAKCKLVKCDGQAIFQFASSEGTLMRALLN